MRALDKIPTTIVTGFLGSGKTTLLRHVLGNAGGLRIAVIVNEFGELGIDGELLRGCGLGCEEDGEGVIELANGCLCCTVQEEFFPVMRELVARRDRIDHILIETSGLALPKPLVQAFQWPEIKSACTVDAVVTVVDGPAVASGLFAADPQAVDAARRADPNLDHQVSLRELFDDQLSCADLVIVSKTDLLDDEDRRRLEARLAPHLPESVKRVDSAHGQVPLELLLGVGAAAEEGIDQRHTHHDAHHEGDDHHHHAHDHFASLSLELPPMAVEALEAGVRRILAEQPVYRVKGFAAVPGKPMRLVLQGVGRRLDRYYDRRWRADEPRITRLVFIGQGLDTESLRACFPVEETIA